VSKDKKSIKVGCQKNLQTLPDSTKGDYLCRLFPEELNDKKRGRFIQPPPPKRWSITPVTLIF
jgi:hypothetical protein